LTDRQWIGASLVFAGDITFDCLNVFKNIGTFSGLFLDAFFGKKPPAQTPAKGVEKIK